MNSNPRESNSLTDNRTIHVYRDPPSMQAAWHDIQPNHRSGLARLGRRPQRTRYSRPSSLTPRFAPAHTDENTAPHVHTAPPAGERSLIRLFARLHRQQEGLTPQDENTIHQRKEVHRLIRMPALPHAARAVRVEQIVGVDCFEQTTLPPRLLVEPKPHHLPWGEFENDVSRYVHKCPFHVFDIQRGRNISRTELEGDISAALRFRFVSPNLIEAKSMRFALPRHGKFDEFIEHFGRYAILSHRWDEGQELSFTDNLLDPSVQQKTGFHKLRNFTMVAKAQYGCRYLWMDTLCIAEEDREKSIPRMFGWYRRACVCIVYLTAPRSIREDPWFTRGWTLQEFLAARQIKVFLCGQRESSPWRSWAPRLDQPSEDGTLITAVISGSLRRLGYEPGLHSAVPLFQAMRKRETTIPEDKVYCLLSALQVDIPIKYGEGFDRAFYRIQAHYLTHSHDRRCFFWDDSDSHKVQIRRASVSPSNSMLPANFAAYDEIARRYDRYIVPASLPDPAISFDNDGVMRIMVSLFPWRALPCELEAGFVPTQDLRLFFASLHFRTANEYYGVLLRPASSTRLHTAKKASCDIRGEQSGEVQENESVIYVRVSFKAVWISELPFHDLQTPEWVCIK